MAFSWLQQPSMQVRRVHSSCGIGQSVSLLHAAAPPAQVIEPLLALDALLVVDPLLLEEALDPPVPPVPAPSKSKPPRMLVQAPALPAARRAAAHATVRARGEVLVGVFMGARVT
jgi:hypothetical protein